MLLAKGSGLAECDTVSGV